MMVKHVALQHAVMSADVSELQAAAAHWVLAFAELYTLPVAPADPVLQKLSGADGGDGAMVEHWALAVQHAVMSPAVLVLQVPAAHWALAAAGLYTKPLLPVLQKVALSASLPMVRHLALVESLQHFATSVDVSLLQGSVAQTLSSLAAS